MFFKMTFAQKSPIWLLLLISTFLLLIPYQLTRAVFFVSHSQLFAGQTVTEAMWIFLAGLRFDLAAICTAQAPLVLLGLLPWGALKSLPIRVYGMLFVVLTWLFQFPILAVNLADTAYYPFTGRRSTLSVFSMQGDFANQFESLVLQYWYFFVLGVLLGVLLGFLLRFSLRLSFGSLGGVSMFRHYLPALPMLALVVLAARGGTQLKPLQPAHAYSDFSPDQAALVLNTGISMMRTRSGKDVQRQTWLTEAEVSNALNSPGVWQPVSSKRPNFVLLILESFALEYMKPYSAGPSKMPFLESLVKESVFFPNHFAGGRRSIDVIPAVLAGLPNLMQAPFVNSPFSANRIVGIGSVLQKHGYQTGFFHGGINGTMSFDSMAGRLGMIPYYGMDEYPDPEDFDGTWGIFDGPFCQFALEKMGEMQEPFLSLIFTLSSHNPYNIPEEAKSRIAHGSLAIHQSVRYVDEVVQEFFEEAEKQPWYQNTVFFITADHTADNENPDFANQLGAYRVPLWIYDPSGKLPKKVDRRIAQHADYPATIAHLAGIDSARHYWPLGQSLFDKGRDPRALFLAGGLYYLIRDNHSSVLTPDGKMTHSPLLPKQFDLLPQSTKDWDPEAQELIFRALIQRHHNGMHDNSLGLR